MLSKRVGKLLRGRLVNSTAEAAALFRAAGALVADQRFRGPDYMAAALLPWSMTLSMVVKVPGIRRLAPVILQLALPGALWFEIIRTKYIDDVVREEVHAGATQVLILGSGFDSRPYRMSAILAETIVFEVDRAVVSALKRARINAVLGWRAPTNVRYVAADLERDHLGSALQGCGYNAARRSVVVLSGVTQYLTPVAMQELLGWLAGQAVGTCAVFDYCWQEVIDGSALTASARTVRTAAARHGEEWRFGIRSGKAAEYVVRHHLQIDEDLQVADVQNRYLRSDEGAIIGPVWSFGGFARVRVPPTARGGKNFR